MSENSRERLGFEERINASPRAASSDRISWPDYVGTPSNKAINDAAKIYDMIYRSLGSKPFDRLTNRERFAVIGLEMIERAWDHPSHHVYAVTIHLNHKDRQALLGPQAAKALNAIKRRLERSIQSALAPHGADPGSEYDLLHVIEHKNVSGDETNPHIHGLIYLPRALVPVVDQALRAFARPARYTRHVSVKGKGIADQQNAAQWIGYIFKSEPLGLYISDDLRRRGARDWARMRRFRKNRRQRLRELREIQARGVARSLAE